MEPRPEPPELAAEAAAPFTLVVGLDLVPLIDPSLGGSLFAGVSALRAQLAAEQGLVLPALRCVEDLALRPNTYQLHVRDGLVDEGELLVGYQLAIETPEADRSEELVGFRVPDPVTGQPALWVPGAEAHRAERLGYRVQEPAEVLLSHLARVACDHAEELLERDAVVRLQDRAAAHAATDARMLGPGGLHRLLNRLLAEHVDAETLEAMLVVIDDWLHASPEVAVPGPAEPAAPRLVLVREEDIPPRSPGEPPLAFLEQVRSDATAALLLDADDAHAARVLALLSPAYAALVIGWLPAERRERLRQLLAAQPTMPMAEQIAEAAMLRRRLGQWDEPGPFDFLLAFEPEVVVELLAGEDDRTVIEVLLAMPYELTERVTPMLADERFAEVIERAEALAAASDDDDIPRLDEVEREAIARSFKRALGWQDPGDAGLAIAWVPPVSAGPFGFLQAFDPELVVELLLEEPPSVAAGVLALMDPILADTVLERLPSEVQDDLVVRAQTQPTMSEHETNQIADRLRRRLGLPD